MAAATLRSLLRPHSALISAGAGRGVVIPLSRDCHLVPRADFGRYGAGIINLGTGLGHAAGRQPRRRAGGAGRGEKDPAIVSGIFRF